MVQLFLSYSRQDKELADDLENWLRGRGCEVFLDVGVEDGIAVGAKWEGVIYQALQDADGIVVLVTPNSIESKWCFAEITIARSLGKEIFPVMGAADAVHPLLADVSHANFATERQRADSRLGRDLDRLAADAKPRYQGKRPPFPGLNHFDFDDAAVFFGRNAETKRLQERLHRPRPLHRFVPVVGSSGSGKSSLVRAGLLPKLARRSEWILTPVIYPDQSPLEVLTQAIRQTWRQEVAGETPPSAAQLQQRIEQDFGEVAQDLIHRAGGDRRFLLVVIDQFEELFTSRSQQERESLFQCLGQAAGERLGAVWCVITMRAEFLGEALATVQHKLFDDPLLLPVLARSALPEIIQGPARAAGLKLGEGLVEQMIADTSGGDALPLLAYTLQQLSDGLVRGDTLRLEQYNSRGGVAGALQSKADEMLQELLHRSFSRDRVLETLCKLVTVDDEERAARLRVPLDRFSAEERSILDEFVNVRLLVTSADGPDETVAVAHEAMIRQWQPLTSAVAARRDQIRLEQTLQRTAKEWSRRNRPSVIYSWRGSRLQEAERWLARQTNPPQEIADFIAASLEESKADRSREADLLARRVDKECQKAPEKALLLLLAAADHYVATPRVLESLGSFADRSRLRARIPSDAMPLPGICYVEFTAAELSPDGLTVFAADCGTIEPLRPSTRPVIQALQPQSPAQPWTWLRAWDWTTGRERWRQRLEVCAIAHLHASADGTRLLLVPVRGPAGLYRAEDGELERVLAEGQEIVDARFANDSQRALTLDANGRLQLWDVQTGQLIQALENLPRGKLRIAADDSMATVISRSGQSWISLSDPMTVETETAETTAGVLVTSIIDIAPPLQLSVITTNLMIYDLESSTDQNYPFRGAILDAFFCDHARRVIVVERDRVVVLRAARTTELELTEVAEINIESQQCVASANGSVLITQTRGEVLIWHGGDRETECLARQIDGPVRWARRLDDGRLATCTTEHVRIVAPDSEQMLSEKVLTELTEFARLSADGRVLVTAHHDVIVQRMDESSPAITLVHAAPVTGLAVSASGDRVVTAHDAHLAVWDGTTGARLSVLGEHGDDEGDTYSNVDISPDGRWVAAGTQAGTRSRVFAVDSGQPVHTIAADFVRFSPDGRLLLVNLYTRTSVLEVESGAVVCQFTDTFDLNGGDFSPDGQLVVGVDNSGSTGSARVYRLTDGGCLANLEHPDVVNDACFSPDGGTIVTACRDGLVRFWQTPGPTMILDRARSRVFRELTAAERREYGLPSEPARGL